MKKILILIFALGILPLLCSAQDGFVVKSAGPEISKVSHFRSAY